jgi:hypothetical protein
MSLLPPTVAEGWAVQRWRRIVVIVLAVLALLLLLVTAGLALRAARLEADVAAARVTHEDLRNVVAAYGPVRDAYRQIEGGRTALDAALSDEIAWGAVLANLSRSTPEGIGLLTLDGRETGLEPVSATADPDVVAVAEVHITGQARDFASVTQWLLGLEAQPTLYVDVRLESARLQVDEVSGQQLVVFESRMRLTNLALRAVTPDPPLPEPMPTTTPIPTGAAS